MQPRKSKIEARQPSILDRQRQPSPTAGTPERLGLLSERLVHRLALACLPFLSRNNNTSPAQPRAGALVAFRTQHPANPNGECSARSLLKPFGRPAHHPRSWDRIRETPPSRSLRNYSVQRKTEVQGLPHLLMNNTEDGIQPLLWSVHLMRVSTTPWSALKTLLLFSELFYKARISSSRPSHLGVFATTAVASQSIPSSVHCPIYVTTSSADDISSSDFPYSHKTTHI